MASLEGRGVGFHIFGTGARPLIVAGLNLREGRPVSLPRRAQGRPVAGEEDMERRQSGRRAVTGLRLSLPGTVHYIGPVA